MLYFTSFPANSNNTDRTFVTYMERAKQMPKGHRKRNTCQSTFLTAIYHSITDYPFWKENSLGKNNCTFFETLRFGNWLRMDPIRLEWNPIESKTLGERPWPIVVEFETIAIAARSIAIERGPFWSRLFALLHCGMWRKGEYIFVRTVKFSFGRDGRFFLLTSFEENR